MLIAMAALGKCYQRIGRVVLSSKRNLASQCLTLETLYPCIREMEYAVRGRIPIEASAISNKLERVSKT